jgi:MYXO-CTERM domain-containing protein
VSSNLFSSFRALSTQVLAAASERGSAPAFRRVLHAVSLAAAGAFAAELSEAQVIEPNGVSVPQVGPDTTPLQAYFDSQMEGINALAEASAEPGVFSPLCNFTATLVLRQSQAVAGLAWYNVPTSPTEAPARVFQVVPESKMLGQVINASDIRASPDYQGGFIGFALTRDGGKAVYYSEHGRNAMCSMCTGTTATGQVQMPGTWKMMLAYRSNVHQSSYYIAFEDWPGANESTWQGNDGDFNDQVFLLTGVSCPGGGEPCDTGKQGLCAAGLTQCSFDGKPICSPQYTEQQEKCDNVDNDCNGVVDDGSLCPSDEVCVRGKCVASCTTGEFTCPSVLVCGADGFCIEPACKDVICAAGTACRGGQCVGVCEGVTCPIGQICQLDRCVDPCVNVICPGGTFCDQGVCVGDCTCSGCPMGKACARNGRCVAPGCDQVVCEAGKGCRDGQCVDVCDGAKCPGGAACQSGACSDPGPGVSTPGAGGSISISSGGLLIGTSGSGSVTLPRGGSGTVFVTGGASSSAGADAPRSKSESGCGCRLVGAGRGTAELALLVLLGGLVQYRRRRHGSERPSAR